MCTVYAPLLYCPGEGGPLKPMGTLSWCVILAQKPNLSEPQQQGSALGIIPRPSFQEDEYVNHGKISKSEFTPRR